MPTPTAPAKTEAVKPVYTTPEESQKYHLMLGTHEARKHYVKKDKNPEGVTFVPVQVTANIVGISIDRGEKIDRFYVVKYKKDSEGVQRPLDYTTDPEPAFFIDCKEFAASYKLATE